jgi:hypothetical protein
LCSPFAPCLAFTGVPRRQRHARTSGAVSGALYRDGRRPRGGVGGARAARARRAGPAKCRLLRAMPDYVSRRNTYRKWLPKTKNGLTGESPWEGRGGVRSACSRRTHALLHLIRIFNLASGFFVARWHVGIWGCADGGDGEAHGEAAAETARRAPRSCLFGIESGSKVERVGSSGARSPADQHWRGGARLAPPALEWKFAHGGRRSPI